MFITITNTTGTISNTDLATALRVQLPSLTLADANNILIAHAGHPLPINVTVSAGENTASTPSLYAAAPTSSDVGTTPKAVINNHETSASFTAFLQDATTDNIISVSAGTPTAEDDTSETTPSYTYTFGVTVFPEILSGVYSNIADRTALGTSGRSIPSEASDPTTAAEEWANERAKAHNKKDPDPSDVLSARVRNGISVKSHWTDPLTGQTIGPDVLETSSYRNGMPLASMSNPSVWPKRTGFEAEDTYMAERIGGATPVSFAQKATAGLFRTTVGVQPSERTLSGEAMGFRYDVNDVSGWNTVPDLASAQGTKQATVVSDHDVRPSSQV